MNNTAICAENLSKRYDIGRLQKRHDTLHDSVVAFFGDLIRKNHNQLTEDDYRLWALKDVSFEINPGEVVGIIGRNGAGKSTLLKILSRITEPTSGRAVITGRVGSLLEVATGFHPELTGRENIYLNGAILGMHRSEITRKFDDIVSFAEIDQFLDTPVKRYSSGMYVRLAFAVAAHLEPEILLIDEVLAVGDAAFQKKCIGKMGDVAKEGRTVLFVSHNMSAIQRLCPRSLMFDHGQLVAQGGTWDVVAKYLSLFSFVANPDDWLDLSPIPHEGIGKARFTHVSHSSGNAAVKNRAYTNGPLDLTLRIESDIEIPVRSMSVSFYDEFGTKLVNADSESIERDIALKPGTNLIRFHIDRLYLSPGIYTLGAWMANPPGEVYDWIKTGVNIEVVDPSSEGSGIRKDGAVVCEFEVFQETLPAIGDGEKFFL